MRAIALILIVLTLAGCDVIKSTQLEQAVVKALAGDDRTKSYSFEVSHQDEGEVLITGEVYSAAEIEAVTEIASAVDGVTKVVNRCKLEETGSGMMQDSVVPSPFL